MRSVGAASPIGEGKGRQRLLQTASNSQSLLCGRPAIQTLDNICQSGLIDTSTGAWERLSVSVQARLSLPRIVFKI